MNKSLGDDSFQNLNNEKAKQIKVSPFGMGLFEPPELDFGEDGPSSSDFIDANLLEVLVWEKAEIIGIDSMAEHEVVVGHVSVADSLN